MSHETSNRTVYTRLFLQRFAGVFTGVVCFAMLTSHQVTGQAPKPAHSAAPKVLLPQRQSAPKPQPKAVPAQSLIKAPSAPRVAEGPGAGIGPSAINSQSVKQTIQQRPLPQVMASPATAANRAGAQNQIHIGPWMEAHRTLPLAQQQRALESEPGFRALKPQEQQQLHNRLTQLNSMPPAEREKLIERAEMMERLAPVQRQQVRAAMAQLGGIPEERRHLVSRQFFQIRDMQQSQREAYVNSPEYRSQFNEQERSAITGLLNVAPIYPPLQAQPR